MFTVLVGAAALLTAAYSVENSSASLRPHMLEAARGKVGRHRRPTSIPPVKVEAPWLVFGW